jgi:flavin reductase (DIM6/NTAB) family NADH-FMN oxidoreductase RutF
VIVTSNTTPANNRRVVFVADASTATFHVSTPSIESAMAVLYCSTVSTVQYGEYSSMVSTVVW